MRLAPIWDPTARKPGPRPVHVDLFPLFLGGTVLWGVAGLVCLACYAAGIMSAREAITCLIGVIIGMCLLVWEHNERRIYRLLGADDSDTDAGADTDVKTTGEAGSTGTASSTGTAAHPVPVEEAESAIETRSCD